MRIVVSYNREEWAEVNEVLDLLPRGELQFWIDREALAGGVDWRAELLRKARTADAFVPFLSPRYADSPMCRMELLMARSFKRPICPVMLSECWDELRAQEETRFISTLTVARLGAQQLYGLRVTRADLIERLEVALRNCLDPPSRPKPNVYISYPSASARFATQIHARLSQSEGLRPWVATQDSEIGADWRESQVEALTNCSVHVTVASGGMLQDSQVLRTEVLLSEALGHEVFTVEDPELEQDLALNRDIYAKLERDPAFRRLVQKQWFKASEVGGRLVEAVGNALRSPA